MAPVQDHPLRYKLANELHARPFPLLGVPATAAFLAIKQIKGAAGREYAADLAHLINLLDRHDAPHPQPNARHYSGSIGRYWLKWESHAEFVTYTIFSDCVSDHPFDPVDFNAFPEDWLKEAPGVCITSALIRVTPYRDDETSRAEIAQSFVPESVAVARVLDGSCLVAGDFRIDPAGHQRFLVHVRPDTGPQRVGRVVQRLCEIETYKSLSMLGFSRAVEMRPKIGVLDERLSQLTDDMATDDTPAEESLQNLLKVSAELEAMVARSAFRTSATEAYARIVHQRIEVLREERFEGRQTFGEFMMRRYDPAMRTVVSTRAQLGEISDRAMRAAELLRTRVDVERSAQNQDLLASMDRRADLQLQLQRTVEGLSVVAISTYMISLAGYMLTPFDNLFGVSKELMIAIITLPVIGGVWWAVHNIRKKMR